METKLANFASKGLHWCEGQLGQTLYNHNLKLNQKTCSNDGYVQQGAWTAGSAHVAGANALFADGHVASMKESMELSVWRSLSTRSGGEVLSSATY